MIKNKKYKKWDKLPPAQKAIELNKKINYWKEVNIELKKKIDANEAWIKVTKEMVKKYQGEPSNIFDVMLKCEKKRFEEAKKNILGGKRWLKTISKNENLKN